MRTIKKKNSKKTVAKESLIATLVILLFTFAISFIPYKYSFLKVISQGVFDTDLYDLFYTGKGTENTKRDSTIVLVEIANDRLSIAEQINIINEHQPAVIGIDATFDRAKDTGEDRILIQAIRSAKSIVLSSHIKKTGNDQLQIEENFFSS